MTRKPTLQPFMVYNQDRTSGVSVRARDEQDAVCRGRKWLGEHSHHAVAIAPKQTVSSTANNQK